MNGEFKYFTVSEEDKSWDLALSVVGVADIEKNSNYPPVGHPYGYQFDWQGGRILNEYQLNYITEGFGIFENKYGSFKITPGTIIVLFPGEWHRYRPLKTTGWKEHYIGFNGSLATKLLNSEFFKKEEPLIKVNFKKEIQDVFFMILDNSIKEKSGYQHINTGLIITYIGYVISLLKNKDFEGREIEKKIQQACLMLRERINENIDVQKLADNLNLGYSYFRITFKKYTGLSPLQYHLQLRIKRAEDMLIMTQKPIKEIANELGFQTVFYFSRLFKKKTGHCPGDLRRVR
jgi:AraC-like DNA-binding protein